MIGLCRKAALCAVVLMASALAPAHASVNLYTSTTVFQQNAGPTRTIAFGGAMPSIWIFPTLCMGGVRLENGMGYGNRFLYQWPGAEIKAFLPPNTKSVLLQLGTFYGNAGNFTVKLSSGETFVQNAPVPYSEWYFPIGLVSESPIEWVSVTGDAGFFVLVGLMVPETATFVPGCRSFVYGNNNVDGANSVAGFRVRDDGALTPIVGSPFTTGGLGRPGIYAGARAIVASRDGAQVFASNPGSDTISSFAADLATGVLTLKQTIATGGTAFSQGGIGKGGLSLALAPDDRFLYAGSAGSRDISVFRNSAEALERLSGLTLGYAPDGMQVSPDGKRLMVALPEANATAVLAIGANGALANPEFLTTRGTGTPTDVAVSCKSDRLFIARGDEEGSSQPVTSVNAVVLGNDGTFSELSVSPFTSSGVASNALVLGGPNAQYLFLSDKSSDQIAGFQLASDGLLYATRNAPYANTAGAAPAGVGTTRFGNFLYVANGNDSISGYWIEGFNGELVPAPLSPVSSVPGSNTSSLVVSPPQRCGPSATPMTSFTGAPESAAFGETFTVSATTNSSSSATISASGACSISGTTVTMTSGSGTCTLVAEWPGDAYYFPASATQTTEARKATPKLTWAPPSAISYGTRLSASELNAEAAIPGSFTYSPVSGSVLDAGVNQVLTAVFTPADTTNYEARTISASLTVNPAPLTITADAATKTLNTQTPPLSATYAGFVLEQTAAVLSGSLTCTTTAEISSPVGIYPIVCAGQTSKNYTITYVPGTLRVLYAPAATPCAGEPGHVILQPIRADGTSVWRQGSTIPAKFRVCDGNGVSIGAGGVITNFRLIQTISGTATNLDEEVTATTPDSSFRWDPVAQQWIFNISTNALAADATYVYRIELNDSTFIEFRYGLR